MHREKLCLRLSYSVQFELKYTVNTDTTPVSYLVIQPNVYIYFPKFNLKGTE